MIFSLRKLVKLFQMWILIIVCTIVMYQLLHIIHLILWQTDPYKPPKNHSIQVQASAHEQQPWYMEDLQRLRVFYIMGE